MQIILQNQSLFFGIVVFLLYLCTMFLLPFAFRTRAQMRKKTQICKEWHKRTNGCN